MESHSPSDVACSLTLMESRSWLRVAGSGRGSLKKVAPHSPSNVAGSLTGVESVNRPIVSGSDRGSVEEVSQAKDNRCWHKPRCHKKTGRQSPKSNSDYLFY